MKDLFLYLDSGKPDIFLLMLAVAVAAILILIGGIILIKYIERGSNEK